MARQRNSLAQIISAWKNPKLSLKNFVKISEQIERKSPDTKMAVSELIALQDYTELEQKCVAVNKILRPLSKSRNRKLTSYDNIDPSSLNGQKLYLNIRGTINLAKIFKNYINNLN